MPYRRYYSVRNGLNRDGERYDLTTLKRLILSLYIDFERREYLQEFLGKHCVDENEPTLGSAGHDVAAYVLRKVRKGDLWPLKVRIEFYSEEDLFDMIELLFDHISQGLDGQYHDYGDCGWHFTKFDREAGRAEFRFAINELLIDYGEGFELSEEGEILRSLEAGFETLMSTEIATSDGDNVTEFVDRAIIKYRNRASSLAERKEAVRQLADVLEYLRPELKHVLMTDDESALFNIANNFGIRHHNQQQRTGYDPNIWTSWMFYVYLATIHAAVRLIVRRTETAD